MPIAKPLDDRGSARRTWRRLLLCTLVLGVGAIGLEAWPRIHFWRESQFAEGLARYAATAPDGSAALAVRQVGECGLAGVDSLVRLAGSPRAAVAAAAQKVVLDELTAWETGFRAYGDGRLLGRRLLVLATAIERWASEFGPAAQVWADQLTMEIVDDAGGVPSDQSLELLAACDRALARSPLRRPPTSPLPELPAGRSATAGIEPMEPVPPVESFQSAAQPLANPMRVVGDGSAYDLAVVGEERNAASPPVIDGSGVVERLPPAPWAKSTARGVTPVPALAPEVKPRPLPARPPSADVVDVPSPQRVRANLRQWRQSSDVELAARLRSASPYDALAISTVMRERGASGNLSGWNAKTPAHAAGGVFDGLGRLPPAQARERLRELVAHADPEVRLQALTMMATSSDPQLDEIVRRRAVEDADPRVAELATRIMRGEVK